VIQVEVVKPKVPHLKFHRALAAKRTLRLRRQV
jgi:hypothetical protein